MPVNYKTLWLTELGTKVASSIGHNSLKRTQKVKLTGTEGGMKQIRVLLAMGWLPRFSGLFLMCGQTFGHWSDICS